MTDNEEFENIEQSVKASFKEEENNQVSQRIAQKQSNLPKSSDYMMASNFERIEEQLREDSPEKSPTKERYQPAEEKQGVIIDWSEFDLQYPSLYHNDTDPQNTTVKNEVKGADGKV